MSWFIQYSGLVKMSLVPQRIILDSGGIHQIIWINPRKNKLWCELFLALHAGMRPGMRQWAPRVTYICVYICLYTWFAYGTLRCLWSRTNTIQYTCVVWGYSYELLLCVCCFFRLGVLFLPQGAFFSAVGRFHFRRKGVFLPMQWRNICRDTLASVVSENRHSPCLN